MAAKTSLFRCAFIPASALTLTLLAGAQKGDDGPQPVVVAPGPLPGQPPADALILFDGKASDEWVHSDGRPSEWLIVNRTIACKSGTGNIYTRHKFSDAQVHVEFSIPLMPEAHGQARANSGVYLQGRYEIQILDSFNNPTYGNGSCGALYGQYAPLVNVCRPPQQWQSYDIIFHAPRCAADKTITNPGTVTVLQNGVLVQDHVTIRGRTTSSDDTDVCTDGPLMLQDHRHPAVKETFMQFRNIWIRALSQTLTK